MGNGFSLCCNNCGKKMEVYLSVGMGFPRAYMQNIKMIKDGEFGPEGVDFFKKHPDGAITCERQLDRCTKCGQYQNVYSLDLCVPKDGFAQNEKHDAAWSTAMPFNEASYVAPYSIRQNYTIVDTIKQYCPDCNGLLERVTDMHNLPCPDCSKTLTISGEFRWD